MTSAALIVPAFANAYETGYSHGWATGCRDWTGDSEELKGGALQKEGLDSFNFYVQNGKLPTSARDQYLEGFISGYPIGYKDQCRGSATRIPRESSSNAESTSTTEAEVRSLDGEKYPQTRTGLITEEEAAAMSYAQLRYAINEIYARHGADFPNQRAIANRFRQFEWYHPRIGASISEIENEFSEIERANVKLLARYRDQRRASGER